MSADSAGNFLHVNGIELYYESLGVGEPLLLLHGGLMSTGGFGPVLTSLAEHRRVIGVDLQGHGHTALSDLEVDPQARVVFSPSSVRSRFSSKTLIE